MIEIKEFSNFELIEDKNNPFCNLYKLDSGEKFYIEPVFHTQLRGFFEHYPDKKDIIINRLLEIVKKQKNVVFTGNFEFPLTEAEGFIFLEINDVTDPLQIYVEDKSRGSDYGD